MTLKLPPEQEPEFPSEFSAERPVSSEFTHAEFKDGGLSYGVRRIITICMLLAIVGGALYFVLSHARQASPDEIPTISAEGPVKERPAQPGGIDIPHQDVQVYKELENPTATDKPQVEHLLPPPETPQAPAAIAPPPAVTGAAQTPATKMESLLGPAPKIETTVTEAPSPKPPVLITQSQPQMAPAPAPAPAPVVAPAPVAAPPVPVASAPSPTVAATAATIKATPTVSIPVEDRTKPAAKTYAGKKGPAVQLASVSDESHAHTMMAELQSKYAGILGSAKLRLVRANLGAKGIFYRIQSQPLTKGQADDICAAVRKLKAGCIIVR